MRSSAGLGSYLEHSLPALSHRGNMPSVPDEDNGLYTMILPCGSYNASVKELSNKRCLPYSLQCLVQRAIETAPFVWIGNGTACSVPATTWSRAMIVPNRCSIVGMDAPFVARTSPKSSEFTTRNHLTSPAHSNLMLSGNTACYCLGKLFPLLLA